MITYTAMTPSQTLEDRIVSTINTTVDATATNRMNAEQKEARAQTAPARLQVAEKRQKAADTHQKRKDNAAKARKGKSEKNKEEE